MIREIIAAVLIGLGVICCILSVFGVYRFDYVLSRIHAAAVTDTLASLLIFLGVIVLKGFCWGSAKVLLILVFLWVTGPVATHRIGQVEIMTNPDYDKHCEVKK